MRALGARAAIRCEQAKGGRCLCRCLGVNHGRLRADVETLPLNDPHHPSNRGDLPQLDLFRRASR